MDGLTLPILLVGIVGLMWFMSRRAKNQQKAAVSFRDSLEPGQEVMTGSGLFGTIVEVQEDRITLESGGPGGSRSEWLRAAIAKLVEPPEIEEIDEIDAEVLESEVAAADVDELLAGISAATAAEQAAKEDPVNPYAGNDDGVEADTDSADETTGSATDPESDNPDDEDRKSL